MSTELTARLEALTCEAWLSKAGFGADDDVSDPDDDGLGLFQAAAAAGDSAVRGVPTPVARRVHVIRGKERSLPPMYASCAGYNSWSGGPRGRSNWRTGSVGSYRPWQSGSGASCCARRWPRPVCPRRRTAAWCSR